MTDEPVTDHHKAFMANGPLMARWGQETRTRLVMEFIHEHHLFNELNTFLKKRIR